MLQHSATVTGGAHLHMPVKAQPWIAIRVDGNRRIGSGHVMRCLALAAAAIQRGLSVELLCRDFDPNLAQQTKLPGINIHSLAAPAETVATTYKHSAWLSVSEATDARQSSELLQSLISRRGTPAFIAIDHYALGAPWHTRLRELAPVLAIDELADRPMAPDWLVDQTAGKPADTYRNWVPAYTRCLLGGDYALLRPEFARTAEQLNRKRAAISTPLKILITMGGVDQFDVSGQVLDWLEALANQLAIQVTVVAGASSVHAESLAQRCSDTSYPTQLVVNAGNMAAIMAEHHIAIGAAGTTAWERCALGLPSLNVELAANQEAISNWLAGSGAAINLGPAAQLTGTVLCAAVLGIVQDPKRYQQMVTTAFTLVDGHGCGRVLDITLT